MTTNFVVKAEEVFLLIAPDEGTNCLWSSHSHSQDCQAHIKQELDDDALMERITVYGSPNAGPKL